MSVVIAAAALPPPAALPSLASISREESLKLTDDACRSYNVTVILPYLPPPPFTPYVPIIQSVTYNTGTFLPDFSFFLPPCKAAALARSSLKSLFYPPPEFLASTVQPYVLVPRVRPLRTKTVFVPSLCLLEGGNLTTQITSTVDTTNLSLLLCPENYRYRALSPPVHYCHLCAGCRLIVGCGFAV